MLVRKRSNLGVRTIHAQYNHALILDIALDLPLLLLPFRPLQSDSNAAKTFIRSYFQASVGARYASSIYSDLKLIEPMVGSVPNDSKKDD